MYIFDYVINVFSENPIWQTIWILALVISIFGFLTTKDNKFLIFSAISSLVWWLHFFYIWLFSAAFINFFDIFKNLMALKYKKNEYIFYFLLISYFIIWIFTFNPEKIVSIIPAITSILSVFFIYYLKWIKLKIWFLFILVLWFIYNFFWNSLWGMLSDTILFVSWIIWIFNILRENKNESSEKKLDL